MRRQALDLVGRRNWFYLLSFLVLLPGVIALMIPPSLNTGIDFSGGTEFTVRFEQPVTKDELGSALAELGHSEARVQGTGGNEFLVRTEELEGAESAPAVGPRPPGEEVELRNELIEQFGPLVNDNTGHTEWCDGRVHHSGITTVFVPNTEVLYRHTDGRTYDIDYNSRQEGNSATEKTYAAITARSYHAGMVNAAFMDGSARTIGDDIDPALWRALSTRAGAEIGALETE